MANYNPSWRAPDVGINNVPAYQVSGRPWATGSVSAHTYKEVQFPFVTRWVTVINKSAAPVCVGFSFQGLNILASGSSNYFTVAAASTIGPLEMKVSSLWFIRSGSNSDGNYLDVVAGLTTIQSMRTSGTLGPNFSGSYVGV